MASVVSDVHHVSPVSMVDGQLFDTLAALATELRRKTSKPFGGIQVGYRIRFSPPVETRWYSLSEPHNSSILTTGPSKKAGRHGRLLPASTRHAEREGGVLCLPELGLGGMH